MQRRHALAWSGSLAGIAATAVVAVAAVGGSTFLGFGTQSSPVASAGEPDPTIVTQYDDRYVVVERPAPARSGSGARPAAIDDSSGGAANNAPSNPSAAPTPKPSSTPPSTTRPPSTTPPGATPPGSPVYVSDLPAGWEVPEDWPATRPLPPIPTGCVQGHLEDDLVWNCEH